MAIYLQILKYVTDEMIHSEELFITEPDVDLLFTNLTQVSLVS